MQIVRATSERVPFEPFLALVGHAIAVGIGQLPDARRSGHIQRGVVPQRSLRKHQFVGEDSALVELAVAVGVFQADDSMRLVDELLGRRIVRAGRVGNIQPPFFIKAGGNRPIDQRRPSDEFNRETFRQRKDMPVERHFDPLDFGFRRCVWLALGRFVSLFFCRNS